MYYDYNDIPAFWNDGELPRILVNREWVRYYDLRRFGLNAQKISRDEFDRLVARQEVPPREPAP